MRRFKPGDKVKAFLDANFAGVLVSITERPSSQWIAEGTSSVEFYANVQLKNGVVKTIKLSELMHDDDF